MLATTTIGQPGNPCSGECVACPGEVYHNGGWYRFDLCGASLKLPYEVNQPGVQAGVPLSSDPKEFRMVSTGAWVRLSDAYLASLELGTSYGPAAYGYGSELRLCQKDFALSETVSIKSFDEVRDSLSWSRNNGLVCMPGSAMCFPAGGQCISCIGRLAAWIHRDYTEEAFWKFCPRAEIYSPRVSVQVLSAKMPFCGDPWQVVAYRVSPSYFIDHKAAHADWGSRTATARAEKCGRWYTTAEWSPLGEPGYTNGLNNYNACKATINETPNVLTASMPERACGATRPSPTALIYSLLTNYNSTFLVNLKRVPMAGVEPVYSQWFPVTTATDLETERSVGTVAIYTGLDTAALKDRITVTVPIPFDYAFPGFNPITGFSGGVALGSYSIATTDPLFETTGGVRIGQFNWEPVAVKLRLCNLPANNCFAVRCFSDTELPFPA